MTKYLDAYERLNSRNKRVQLNELELNSIIMEIQQNYLHSKCYFDRKAKHRSPAVVTREVLQELYDYLQKIQNREELRHIDVEKNSQEGVIGKLIKIWEADKNLKSFYNTVKGYCEVTNKDFDTIAIHAIEYRALSKLATRLEKERNRPLNNEPKAYTVCVELPKTFFAINRLSCDDVSQIASSYQNGAKNFIYSGTKYSLEDAWDFKVLEYNYPDEYHLKINQRKDILDEGYFLGNRVFYRATALQKIFPDVTDKFINRIILPAANEIVVNSSLKNLTSNHQTMSKPKIFVGSSTEGLEIAFAIQKNLEHDNVEVTCWPQGVFRLSRTAIASLISSLEKYDFAIFIFSPDDRTTLRGAEVATIRDNVIYETGLFTGWLGVERVFFIKPRGFQDLHLPTDLLGMTAGEYDANRSDKNLLAATGPFCNDVRNIVKELGPMKRPQIEMATSSDLNHNSAIGMLITYFKDNGWEYMSFDNIRKNIHAKLTEDYLTSLMEAHPKLLRRAKLGDGSPGIKLLFGKDES